MNRGNKLWEGHRLMLPELREKAVVTCRLCVFLVEVAGREETRTGCVAGIKEYGTLRKRVPRSIKALELLRRAGKDGLKEVLSRGADPDSVACGLYRPRP
ncbi:MAG: hypothetical protein JL50_18465 [Peptococcaceae bacterium BICA1-7]|nr:MAG: hypothetical protein JL50_18465 [Peptococcaceae bacterium BICA1-7]